VSGDLTPAVRFWYRQSPEQLVRVDRYHAKPVSYDDPPLIVPGMTGLRLDSSARLLDFYFVSRPAEPETAAAEAVSLEEPSWRRLFERAGLQLSDFRESTPLGSPSVPWDERRAWVPSPSPGTSSGDVRFVEAALRFGRLVHFEVNRVWSPEMAEPPAELRVRPAGMGLFLRLSCLVAACVLALRNLRAGRSDRRSALRLALYFFAARFLIWLFRVDHVPDLDLEVQILWPFLQTSVFASFRIWIFYLALEPIVRRFWPETLISWTRLLAGRLRDPLVGRDTLIGVLTFEGLSVMNLGLLVLLAWLEVPVPLGPGSLDGVQRGGAIVGHILTAHCHSIEYGVFYLLLLLVLRVTLRKDWLAALVFVAVSAGSTTVGEGAWFAGEGAPWLATSVRAASVAAVFFLLVRFGLVAVIVFIFSVEIVQRLPFTTDLSAWNGGGTVFLLTVFLLLSAGGLYAALAPPRRLYAGAGRSPAP
jgi:hypothetical protein